MINKWRCCLTVTPSLWMVLVTSRRIYFIKSTSSMATNSIKVNSDSLKDYQLHFVFCQTNVGKELNSSCIITDYEVALLPIVQREVSDHAFNADTVPSFDALFALFQFPAVVHCRCMFHFNQSIQRKITNLGLFSEYLHNASLLYVCRQLSSLFAYFEHQWMYGVVPMLMWNFHKSIHRTNNNSDGKNVVLFRFHCRDLSLWDVPLQHRIFASPLDWLWNIRIYGRSYNCFEASRCVCTETINENLSIPGAIRDTPEYIR